MEIKAGLKRAKTESAHNLRIDFVFMFADSFIDLNALDRPWQEKNQRLSSLLDWHMLQCITKKHLGSEYFVQGLYFTLNYMTNNSSKSCKLWDELFNFRVKYAEVRCIQNQNQLVASDLVSPKTERQQHGW